MKAVILAGGFGTGIRSIAYDVPKPMMMIAGKPFIEHQMKFLKDCGIIEIIIAVYHLANQIKSYFGNGLRWGVDITYSEEDSPLGTAGAIKKAEKYLKEAFIVLNGDTYTQIDLNQLISYHKAKKGLCTIAVTKSSNPNHHGTVVVREDRILDFTEKGESTESIINSGVYVLEPEVLNYIRPEEKVSLENEIFPILAKENLLWAFEHEEYCMDIGRPETYTQFKQDVLDALLLKEYHRVRDAMNKISNNGINAVLVTDERKRLLGVVNDRIIKEYMLKGGNLDHPLSAAMIRDPIVAKITDDKSKIDALLQSGINHLPIIDDEGKIRGLEFRVEKIKSENYPIIRGKSPLRISFAGGGTDLEHFFKKHGGVVINPTINKYCHATMSKRADSKIVIQPDSGEEIVFNSKNDLNYNGNQDLVKSIIKEMNPDFGFELNYYNDVPPGRGLGSSASFAVLIIRMLDYLMDLHYDDYKVAEIAHKAEIEQLGIKGGWQDQYAAVTGGFSFMEFNVDKTIIYPLRLKEDVIHELNEHLLLCYVGKTHFSGHQHSEQENEFKNSEKEIVELQNEHKKIAIELKNSLLRNELDNIGSLLRHSWEIKKKLSSSISDPRIDNLYEVGLKNGAYGGRLLGSGGGGYILFFFSPKKRIRLVKALHEFGGEIMDFHFEFLGTKIWPIKFK